MQPVKQWQNDPNPSTPLSASALMDLEQRLRDHAAELSSAASGSIVHKTQHEPGGSDALTALTALSFATANRDGTAGVPSLRSHGTAAGQSAAGVNAKGYVNHGAVTTVTRPSGYSSIEWFGSAQPANAVVGDTWVNVA